MRKPVNYFKGKLFDCHNHSEGIDYKDVECQIIPTTQSTLDLSSRCYKFGIDYAVSFPMPCTIYYKPDAFMKNREYIPSGCCSFPFEYENKSLFASVKQFDLPNIIPFANISLRDKIDEQIDYLNSIIDDTPIYGLKYHPDRDTCPCVQITNNARVMDFLKENDLPLIIHSSPSPRSHPLKILEIVDNYPSQRICVAHLGKFDKKFFDELENKKRKNLFIDTSPLSTSCTEAIGKEYVLDLDYSNPSQILDILEKKFGCLIWATDTPYLYSHKRANNADIWYRNEIALVNNSRFKNAIMSTNPIRFLFGIDS